MKSERRVGVLFAALTVLALAGCQSVWVHPEATGTKFRDDTYLCRYGEARPSEERLRASGEARAKGTPDEVIPPAPPPTEPDTINSGSGTNINVNVATIDARRRATEPIVIPGHKPRLPSYRECMDILGWRIKKRLAPTKRWARAGD